MIFLQATILFLVLWTNGLCAAWGQSIQYKPLSSKQNHSLSAGLHINTLNEEMSQSSGLKFPGVFLNYAFYFPQILPKSYREMFFPAITTGGSFFGKTNTQNCQTKNPAIYHAGLKGKIQILNFLNPFAGGGFARIFCYKPITNLFNDNTDSPLLSFPPTKKFHFYFSYGFTLSLKLIDKTAIYALDQDHGINDLSLMAECFHYHFTTGKSKSLHLCQLGFLLLF